MIEKKSEVFNYFRNLKSLVERETERKIKCLWSNGGNEYFFGKFNCYLQQMGIQREFSYRYTPEQKGVAERKNRSVVEAARAMLEEKCMPKFYWAKAIWTIVYIQNRIGEKVSLYFKRKPNLRHLRVFDSIAYVHVPDEKRKKMDAKSEKCILVGHSKEQVRVSRDVVSNKSTSWYALPTPTLDNSDPLISEDEASEADMIQEEEEDFSTLEDSLISFRLSGPNEEVSRNDQQNRRAGKQ